MEPHERIDWCIYNLLRSYFKLIFIDIFEEKFTYRFGFIAIVIVFGFGFNCSYYTATNYEFAIKANAIGLFLFTVHVFVEYITVHKLRPMVKIIDFIIDIYRSNSTANQAIFSRYAFLSQTIIMCMLMFNTFCCVLYLPYPIIAYFRDGERLPLYPVYAPLLNENSTIDYIVLVILQLLNQMLVVVVNSASDLFITIVFIHMLMLSTMFGIHLRELNTRLHEDKDQGLIKSKLLHLIREHRAFFL